jgi:hypothetical protein
MLKRTEIDGALTGVPIAAQGSQLTHLFFVDDNLLFYLANFME